MSKPIHRSAIPFVLLNVGKTDVYSRGSVINIHGDEVCYIGCTPDKSAYFWFGPGNARYLTEDQLREAGYVLEHFATKG